MKAHTRLVMGDLSDTPLMHADTVKNMLGKVLLVLAGIFLSSLSWGGTIGQVLSVDVKVDYTGQGNGRMMGQSMPYRITLNNKGIRSFTGSVQVSVHSNGAFCETKNFEPGARLPNSFSPLRDFSIAPGSEQSFGMTYDVPTDLCPMSGHIRVHITYADNGPHFVTLKGPDFTLR
jgi:hypothetical protein